MRAIRVASTGARTTATASTTTTVPRRRIPNPGRLPETDQLPRTYADWVRPGARYNRVGYYEVPNSRIVYRDSGAVRSFGIASMISWRYSTPCTATIFRFAAPSRRRLTCW